MRAIVTGMVVTFPVGGVAWDYLQYVVGLERLGWEVYYLEDTGSYIYDPSQRLPSADPTYGVHFLERTLAALSPTLAKRWHYRDSDGRCYGVNPDELRQVLRDTDLFLNVSGGTLLRPEYASCGRTVLIDSDPGWNHFVNYPKWDAQPGWQDSLGYRAHDYYLTYAEKIGQEDCLLPTLGLDWQPTRPLVLLDQWQAETPSGVWTTVMTWKHFRQPIEHEGVKYGTKELEFKNVESLPSHVTPALEVAAGGDPPIKEWQKFGWTVVDAHEVSVDHEAYRHYLQRSRGEFSVAKNVYVATHSGWFSCRSICYLAAGLPVVVQDTGFSDFLPCGEGLVAFTDLDTAVAGIETVERAYERHQQAAQQIARDYFSAEVVLTDLLAKVGLEP